ncbi:MAG: AAA family ATPase [Pseudomonadota bacterium]
MYESFYKFREKPFELTPDPGFLYLGNKHSTGLTMLEYGLTNRAGITVLTGEIGSGKTTLIRRLLDNLGDDLVVGLISNTHKSFGDLMHWIAVAFDLPSNSDSKAARFDEFSRFLIEQYAANKRTVLIVDESQNLDSEALEELRLLTNINADKDQVLQLVLVGQPELRETLRAPGLHQFVQRIGVDFHLGPLSGAETDEYIKHRLKNAGGASELFDPVARRFIHYQCGGVPRLINSLCDTALVYGFADQLQTINAKLVFDIVNERLSAGLFGAGVVSGASDNAGANDESTLEKMRSVLAKAKAEVDAEHQNLNAVGQA